MRKIFKQFIFGLLFLVVSILPVSALTIKESVNENSNYDTILDNSIVMGVTKFEPGVILTAGRASRATANDIKFATLNTQNLYNYDSTKIYYFLVGDWFLIDEDNKLTVVTDEETLEMLNNSEIYYVNNVEKKLEFEHNIVVLDGYDLVGVLDDADRVNDIVVDGNKVTVPATILKFNLSIRNKTTGDINPFISYVRENNDLSSTVFVAEDKIPKGTISWDPGYTGGVEPVVDGDEITFDGEIEWYGADVSLGRVEGNRVGVKITAPEEYTADDLNNATFTYNGTTYEWLEVTDDIVDGRYVYVYPIVSNDNKEIEIVISWVDGYEQTFKIKVTDESTFALPPKGTIEKGDTTGGELEYNVVGDTITIDGEIEWYKKDASVQNGREAGNYASVKISANSKYDSEFLNANTKVTIDERDVVDWDIVTDDDLGEDTYFVYYPRFDANTRSHTVTIEWESGNIQTFTIELEDSATLAEEN